jgi:hypothetical protein
VNAGFGQLYYTSCEQGLAGYPGFQFNAATPGLRPHVMADVEVLAGYEPPRVLAREAGVAQLDRYPVNLCYHPGPDTVIANVVFVGNDYSHRFGNYFAHALVTEDPPGSLGDLLPIELWRAPCWTSAVAAGRELPALPARPRRGPLDRRVVDEFVRSHRCFLRLPDLLTAVDQAVSGGERKVVIVDRDADAVAHWIAAVSYLLPETLVRRMSFATYQHQPRYSRLDVVGTVPGSDVDRSAFDSHLLFDMVDDRSSVIATHPLADLLSDIGVLAAPEVWDRAAALADSSEGSLDDWHPVLAAAVVRPHVGGPADAAVIAPWLAAHAGRLGTRVVSDVGGRVLASAALGADAAATLRALGDAARIADARDLGPAIELTWVDVVLRAVLCGHADFAAAEIELRTAEARDRARETLARDLAAADPGIVATLLGWASRCGIDPGERALRTTGNRVFGPLVLAQRTDQRIRSLLGTYPPLRWGAVDHLVSVVRQDLDAVVAALGGGVGELLEAGKEHKLGVAVVIADVRDGRLTPAGALREIAPHEADAAVLRLLWPAGRWSHGEAVEVLEALRLEGGPGPIVLDWLATSVLSRPEPDEERQLDQLCGLLQQPDLYPALPAAARDRIDTHVAVTRLIGAMVGATDRDFEAIFAQVCRSHGASGPQRRQMIVTSLLARFAELPVGRRAVVLLKLSDVRAGYLSRLNTPTRPPLDTVARHVLVAWKVRTTATDRSADRARVEIARATSALRDRLRRRDLREVTEMLRKHPDAAFWFTQQPRRQGFARLFRPRAHEL